MSSNRKAYQHLSKAACACLLPQHRLPMLCHGNMQAPSHFSTPTIGARLALLNGDMKIMHDSGAGKWPALHQVPSSHLWPPGALQ